MLYSQIKERENLFINALKATLPFIIVILLWLSTILKENSINLTDIILLLFLTLFYVYYVVYLINNGFNRSIIDPITHTFTQEKIRQFIQSALKSGKSKSVIMIGVKNLTDINERYGRKNGDEILSEFIKNFNKYLEKNRYMSVPIGLFENGYFILSNPKDETYLNHFLKIFERQISKNGIKNIEIKVGFAAINYDGSKNLDEILSNLYDKINNLDENDKNFNENYVEIIKLAIKNYDFLFKFQTMKNLKNSNDMVQIIQKFRVKGLENLPKIKMKNLVNKSGFEIDYDIKILEKIFKELDFNEIKNKIFIEVSAVSLRNLNFQKRVFSLITQNKINANKIVFEFTENRVYDHIIRFKEILLEYKKLGFDFAFSHFGGNNAGFEYLKHLPINFLIYDIEFSKGIFQKKNQILLTKFNQIANELGIKTIIRFIDKEEIYQEIAKTKIDFIQGFYIEKPRNLI